MSITTPPIPLGEFAAIRNVGTLAVYSCWLLVLVDGERVLGAVYDRLKRSGFPALRPTRAVLLVVRAIAAVIVLGFFISLALQPNAWGVPR